MGGRREIPCVERFGRWLLVPSGPRARCVLPSLAPPAATPITVPLVAALGLGLAETVPGRSPLIDGFGLIAFASLFPMISVMAYAQLSEFRARRTRAAGRGAADG